MRALHFLILLLLVGCRHVPNPTPVDAFDSGELKISLYGAWLRNNVSISVNPNQTIELSDILMRSGGYLPFVKKNKFPSTFYIFRKGASEDQPIKIPFDGRKFVTEEGVIDPAGIPSVTLAPGDSVLADWTLL